MADHLERLKAALAGRYAVERELGAGGMATVYLAEDLRHHRQVAVKVLRPDLAATLGPDRFLREIELAARLTHPHILPLHDSGEADGLLFYVMPYIRGESLREKIRREGELPIDEAVRLLREVVDALAYAHAEGVVHRDIKPDNVLLTGRHAVVSDFGVAKAVSEATGREKLTTAGVALGTPTYMAPEQIAADPHIDHRADIYAIGVMAYEMLTGRPPLEGATPQAVLAAHISEVADPVAAHRDTVPPALDDLVMRCLAKKPADRWQRADEMLPHLEAFTTPSGGVTPTGMTPLEATASTPRGWRWGAVAGAAIIVAGLGWYALGSGPRVAPSPANPNSVAVLPFRVSGAPSLEYLREGMVDALHGKLTGDGGLRALDPGTVLNAWRQAVPDPAYDLPVAEAARVGENVGAAYVLMGSLLETGTEISLTGSLRSVPLGDEVAAASVTGVMDSLPAMMDRLAAQLLSLHAGEDRGRVGRMSPSLEAVQAYLEGTRAWREQRYLDAVGHFDRALSHDSSFALAAFHLTVAAAGAGNTNTEAFGPAARLTWSLRDSLSPRDRATVVAMAGRNYPGWTSDADRLVDAERAVELAPEAPFGWLLLGGMQFDLGRYLADSSLIRRGISAMDRALALDSSQAQAAAFRARAALDLGDTATVRSLRTRVETETAQGERAGAWAWWIARALQDSTALHDAASRLGRTQNEVTGVGYVTTRLGLPYDDWGAATARFEASAVTDRARHQALEQRRKIAMLKGQSRVALAYTDSLIADEWFLSFMHDNIILNGIFGEGYDSAAAAKAADLERLVDDGSVGSYVPMCRLGWWRAFNGDRAGAQQALAVLQGLAEGGASPKCPASIEAILAVDSPDAAAAIDRLDSLLAVDVTEGPYNLVLARLREYQGDHRAALTATRRTAYIGNSVMEQMTHPFMLREEGRLAAMVGDTAGAIRAYEHYLAIRTDPDPAVQPEVDAVRRALADLVGEGRR